MSTHDLTHASFFSGVGGLDLGLERAGWRTVSFSEIDPYASAVLAERWPGVPNLGDIVRLAAGSLGDGDAHGPGTEPLPNEVASAVLWSGGFPCQDLSVAGKRAGFAGERSSLAFAFLDLVERHRPPAILLENVPGLLSSNGGRDFGTLKRRLAELGYVGAFRVLDAQFFGVPQRRRRVFICALHGGAGFGADSAAEVLSVGSRCDGHSASGDEAREGVTRGVADGPSVFGRSGHQFGNLTARDYKDQSHMVVGAIRASGGGYPVSNNDEGRLIVNGSSPDPSGVREADGLAGRLDDRELAPTLRVGPARPQDGGPGDTVPIIVNALDQRRGEDATDTLLPLGLDSHRYRCCGNGVVSNVSEWVGIRLSRAFS